MLRNLYTFINNIRNYNKFDKHYSAVLKVNENLDEVLSRLNHRVMLIELQLEEIMPSTSKKQHNLMEAVAHSPEFAKKVGIKQSVGKDFAKADDKAGITKSHKGKSVKKEKDYEKLYNKD